MMPLNMIFIPHKIKIEKAVMFSMREIKESRPTVTIFSRCYKPQLQCQIPRSEAGVLMDWWHMLNTCAS